MFWRFEAGIEGPQYPRARCPVAGGLLLLLGGPETLSHNVPRSNTSLLSQKSQ